NRELTTEQPVSPSLCVPTVRRQSAGSFRLRGVRKGAQAGQSLRKRGLHSSPATRTRRAAYNTCSGSCTGRSPIFSDHEPDDCRYHVACGFPDADYYNHCASSAKGNCRENKGRQYHPTPPPLGYRFPLSSWERDKVKRSPLGGC